MGRAVTWIHIKTDARAEQVPYLAGPVLGWTRQEKRGKKTATMLTYYRGADIVIVGHSNGGGIARIAVNHSEIPISHLHLISPATPADFEANGLLKEIRDGGIEGVTIWRGGRDWALSLSRFFWFNGREVLGKVGPRGIGNPVAIDTPVQAIGKREVYVERRLFHVPGTDTPVWDICVPQFGHNSWFDVAAGNFDWLMNKIGGEKWHSSAS